MPVCCWLQPRAGIARATLFCDLPIFETALAALWSSPKCQPPDTCCSTISVAVDSRSSMISTRSGSTWLPPRECKSFYTCTQIPSTFNKTPVAALISSHFLKEMRSLEAWNTINDSANTLINQLDLQCIHSAARRKHIARWFFLDLINRWGQMMMINHTVARSDAWTQLPSLNTGIIYSTPNGLDRSMISKQVYTFLPVIWIAH